MSNKPTLWKIILDEITDRYYWRLMIGCRLLIDNTFRLTGQFLYNLSLLSYKIWQIPPFVYLLPIARFFTNSVYAFPLIKRALTHGNLPLWDKIYSTFSALVFLGLGVGYLITSFAGQPLSVFLIILAVNVWDLSVEIKGYLVRHFRIKYLKDQADKIHLSPELHTTNDLKLIQAELQYLENAHFIQIWYLINVTLTLIAVGLTLAALFNPAGFLASNLIYFSASLFITTGVACVIHAQKQCKNDAKWEKDKVEYGTKEMLVEKTSDLNQKNAQKIFSHDSAKGISSMNPTNGMNEEKIPDLSQENIQRIIRHDSVKDISNMAPIKCKDSFFSHDDSLSCAQEEYLSQPKPIEQSTSLSLGIS